jgi:hypothetical protein
MAGIQIDGVNNKIDFDDDQDTSISSATDDTLVIESGGVNIASITAGEFAINEGSADIDFRVESNASTKMLFVDANEEHVHIGTGDINAFGNFVVESSADCDVEFFSNVGNGTIGVIELFFTTDGSADHQSIASIVAQQPSGDQASRKGEILFKVSDNGGPTTALTIANNRTVSGDLNDTSDENLKKNIEDLGTSTDIIKALKPRKFDWKDESKGADKSGFIAQEVATVLPNAVVGGEYAPDTYYEEGDDIPKKATVGDIKVPGNMGKAINTTAILAHAVKTIQELEARIATLEGN